MLRLYYNVDELLSNRGNHILIFFCTPLKECVVLSIKKVKINDIVIILTFEILCLKTRKLVDWPDFESNKK